MNGGQDTPVLSGRRFALIFGAFAIAYFLSTLLRAIPATLSPVLMDEFVLSSGQLGLLAAAYFLGFACMQLPLGSWLDRGEPRGVELSLLGLAVLGCVLIAFAPSFEWLLLARVMMGVGVSACLMAPLTLYRRWFTQGQQMRSASWMLMVGSLGAVAASLPVQWLLPVLGWRPLFWGLAAALLLAMGAIAWAVPKTPSRPAAKPTAALPVDGGYAQVWRSPAFLRVVPLAFFFNGGMAALSTLWVVPWLIRVVGQSPAQAAQGLFIVSLALLLSYWLWGWVSPWLVRRGWGALRLITALLPLNLLALAALVVGGAQAGVLPWVLYVVTASTISLAQPAMAMIMPTSLAGRALSSYNMAVFVGIFVLQWSIGLLIDLGEALGYSPVNAFRLSLAVLWLGAALAYGYFFWTRSYDRPQSPSHA